MTEFDFSCIRTPSGNIYGCKLCGDLKIICYLAFHDGSKTMQNKCIDTLSGQQNINVEINFHGVVVNITTNEGRSVVTLQWRSQ